MIEKEYERLMELVEKSATLEVSMEEVLKESVGFFEMLRLEFPKAEYEKRQEMLQMMSSLHAKLQEVSKKSAEASGMSEEELQAYAEDPGNFSPDQWHLVQETRKKLYDSARKFSATMEEKKRKSGDPDQPSRRRTIKSKTRRARRNDWTKS